MSKATEYEIDVGNYDTHNISSPAMILAATLIQQNSAITHEQKEELRGLLVAEAKLGGKIMITAKSKLLQAVNAPSDEEFKFTAKEAFGSAKQQLRNQTAMFLRRTATREIKIGDIVVWGANESPLPKNDDELLGIFEDNLKKAGLTSIQSDYVMNYIASSEYATDPATATMSALMSHNMSIKDRSFELKLELKPDESFSCTRVDVSDLTTKQGKSLDDIVIETTTSVVIPRESSNHSSLVGCFDVRPKHTAMAKTDIEHQATLLALKANMGKELQPQEKIDLYRAARDSKSVAALLHKKISKIEHLHTKFELKGFLRSPFEKAYYALRKHTLPKIEVTEAHSVSKPGSMHGSTATATSITPKSR